MNTTKITSSKELLQSALELANRKKTMLETLSYNLSLTMNMNDEQLKIYNATFSDEKNAPINKNITKDVVYSYLDTVIQERDDDNTKIIVRWLYSSSEQGNRDDDLNTILELRNSIKSRTMNEQTYNAIVYYMEHGIFPETEQNKSERKLSRYDQCQQETNWLDITEMIKFYRKKGDKEITQKLVKTYITWDYPHKGSSAKTPCNETILDLYITYGLPQSDIDTYVRKKILSDSTLDELLKDSSSIDDLHHFLANVKNVYGTTLTLDEIKEYIQKCIKALRIDNIDTLYNVSDYDRWYTLLNIEKPDNWEQIMLVHTLSSKIRNMEYWSQEERQQTFTQYVTTLVKQENKLPPSVCKKISEEVLDFGFYEDPYMSSDNDTMYIQTVIRLLQRLWNDSADEKFRNFLQRKLTERLIYTSQMESQIPLLMKHLRYTKEDILDQLIHTNMRYKSHNGHHTPTTIDLVENTHALNLRNVVECYGLEDNLDMLVQQHLPYFRKSIDEYSKNQNYAHALYVIKHYNLEQYPWFSKQKNICEQMNTEEVEVYSNPAPKKYNRKN